MDGKWLVIGIFALAAIIAAFIFTNVCVGCATAGAAQPPSGGNQMIKNISVQQAYSLINENSGNEDFVILDIRTPEEFAQGHLAGAVNMDFYSDDFELELDGLEKNKTYLVYCRTAHRSGLAMPLFRELGFKDVYNMVGGITAWVASGYPTE